MLRTFNEFIRDQRRKLNLTQRQVAEAIGLKSIASLSDIEAGNRKPSLELLPALARILQIEVETLKSYDIRNPIAEVKALLKAHPEYAVAFRRLVEHSRDLGPDEVLRRIESSSNSPDDSHTPHTSEQPRISHAQKKPAESETTQLL